MKTKTRMSMLSAVFRFTLGLLFACGLIVQLLPTQAAPTTQTLYPPESVEGIYDGVSTAVKFDISPPLRDIPPKVLDPDFEFVDYDHSSLLDGPLGPQDIDPIVQDSVGPNAIPTPIVSFDAFDNQLTYTPPDPVGDVGPNHYIAMSNVHFAVFDKSGNTLYGPVPNNTLWSGFGGDCETNNSGDPIVVYDQLADRWMLTQFTSSGPTYYNCVALSVTGDPLGTYYRWAFAAASFPDYPKYGVWPDAYYISTREDPNIGAYALNRAQMLAGNPSPQVVSFHVSIFTDVFGYGLLPADLDGTTLPPAGSPEYYMGTMDDGGTLGAPQDAMTLWEFDVDWAVPGNSSFTLVDTLSTSPYDAMFPCSPGSRDCIPQPGTSEKLDILSYRQRPLWRLAYRNFGTHESMVTNQAVEAGPGMAGIRWWEVRNPSTTPVIYQEGTYAPGLSDGIHRWMGSIAMDMMGNMALGYSASDATVTYPSVWYTGRLATDPLGTMAQGEGTFVDGSGSQLSTGSRWGDYTSMNVDPVDDCTFWYINEYYPATSTTEWYLRVGAFKFPSCGTGAPIADLEVEKTSDPAALVAPGGLITYTLTATNNGPDPIPLTDTLSITNTTFISMPTIGPAAADPYPSVINVPNAGTVLDVNVNLYNFSHSFPEDVNVLLVGPAGQNVMLMSDVGYGIDASNLDFTFDDAAADYLPCPDASLVGGTYKPTDCPDEWGDENFPPPAPAGLYGTLLSAFNSTNPAGDWNLFVYDDTNGDDGEFAGGWSVEITYELPGIILTDTLPTDFSYTGYLAPDWSCSINGQVVTCTSPDMPIGSSTIELYGNAPTATGYITNTVEIVTEAVSDPDPSNNTAFWTVLIDTAPVAGDDNYNTDEDVPLVVAAPGVLNNDSDPNGDPLSTVLDTPPIHGNVILNIDGSFIYNPDQDFNGVDQFVYQLSDGYLEDTATVFIDVAPVNDPPVAGDDNYTTDEDTPLMVTAPGVLGNDVDVDSPVLTLTLVTSPVHGSLVLAPDGSFTYTPTLNYNGPDGFGYILSDGVLSDTAQVSILIDSVNDLPVVSAGDDQTVDEGDLVQFAGSFNDPGRRASPLAGEEILWDFGDSLTTTGTLTPTHTYLDNGVFTVTLIITDSEGGVGMDELLVTVNNVAPNLATMADQSVSAGESLTITGVYTDPGALDTHTVVIEWIPGITETINLTANVGTFTANFTYTIVGDYTVPVTITDKDGGIDTQTFMVHVASSSKIIYLPLVSR